MTSNVTRNNFKKNWTDSWIVMMALFYGLNYISFSDIFFFFERHCETLQKNKLLSARTEQNGSNFNQSLRWLLFISRNELYNFISTRFGNCGYNISKKNCFNFKATSEKNGLKCTIIVSNGKGYLRTRIYWLKMTNNYQLWTLYGNQWSSIKIWG